MTLAQKIVGIIRGGGDIRFAPSGDGVQCWVRLAGRSESGTSANDDAEKALDAAEKDAGEKE